MARPPLPLGTWGKITRKQLAPGRWRARARYRDYDGRTRPVERFGKTGAAAERALLDALAERTPPSAGTAISRDTTLKHLATAWIDTLDLREQSIAVYQSAIDRHITPALGDVRIREVGTGLLDAFLRTVPTPASARLCRVVLTGMFGLAARHDAIDRNPVRETQVRSAGRGEIRAMTVAEVAEFRCNVAMWSGGNETGPARGVDLPEIVDLMLGTGARIGEVLAIRIQDCNLGANPPTVTITGTIVRNHRQPAPKTEYSHRALMLPSFAAAALRRQVARGLPAEDGLVFPSRTGGPRQADNVRRQLREARGDEFDWVTPKVFRKTVATAIERAMDIESAAAQLGHSGTAVTRMHYVERTRSGPDARHVLDEFSPVSRSVDDVG
ncbi:tyrosine-type recombinase/integrase [Gordonia sp. NB41Y]|uniref:tyrosine-type recombinase/integrase n=1 Tax=Gordonia sp. NB41Y TaxID=875808 RepID=UPI0006B2076C|nr:tyrosine-type recombinase/integrase [Gordonia sp. NB41Y]KOY49475.1 hypothetical protein ISGA_10090 [Gordonia sp. NB41Y]WLP90217.1 tyrosine-type recombinase/integrase [Gordonia sp. NB41Y]